MPTYYLWNIGCQMNKSESERLGGYLEAEGYRLVETPRGADLVLMNTCVVRGSAEERVVGELGYLAGLKKRSPRMSIVVTGCFVESKPGALKERFPHVDLWFPAGKYEEFTSWMKAKTLHWSSADPLLTAAANGPTAFVPVIQGCDYFCTYCIVPYRRGREHSRPVDEVVCEVEGLSRRGIKEITLLGQNINSYGHDLPGRPDLADLLAELNDVPGLVRIRFLTSHPRDVDGRFIDAMARLGKVCECISLPAQSGDDRVLQAMRRGYTIAQYRDLVQELRQHVPGIAISTDIIVGFPGETEAEFQHTVDLVRDLRFDTVHIAAYSPRPGTIASRTLPDTTPIEEKKRRVGIIEQLQESIASEISLGLQGRRIEVLVERKTKGKWEGRTRTDKLVFFSDNADHTGELVDVEITSTSPWSLQATLLSRSEKALAT
ncbi:MAG: tRNA (N6-isopentenyl adenosine(37)-C2)-methylthiotransferase MiaB [Chloroflexi bacterium]|nr:tRNA (N6-isopentenyl adenosine(37)-C2)-methylthiotransferase MiaB [Chloroflexota bacterium]